MRAAVKDSAGHTMRSFAKSLLVYASYWYLLGPAFGVSLQLYLNHRFGLVNALGPATFPDVICVASCIVLMCYMAASSFFSLRAQRRRLALASSVCGVASMLAMVLPTLVGVFSGAWALVGIMLFSFFLMTHLLLWLEVFVCYDNMVNLVYVLAVAALACCLCWFLIGLEGPRLLWALAFVVALAGGILLKGFRSTVELDSPRSESTGRVGKAGGGLLIVTFFFGVGFMYTTSFMSLEEFHTSFDWTVPVYALLLCAAVLVFSRRIRVSTLYGIAMPVAIAGILLALFDNPLQLSPTILNEIGFFTYLVFILVLYCILGREWNSDSPRVACLLILGLYLGLFAGRQLFSAVDALVDEGSQAFVHELLAVSLLVVLVVCMMGGWRIINKIVSNGLSRPRFDHITELENRETAMHIASIYKLSEREREVLELMLEGKTATEIAESLIIAHGTAKAHINNIYKKVGIHTREELLAMIPGRLSS